jgi:hypothetical protein
MPAQEQSLKFYSDQSNPELAVSLDELKAAWNNCSTSDDAACQLYDALFDEGDPLSFEFNEDFPSF